MHTYLGLQEAAGARELRIVVAVVLWGGFACCACAVHKVCTGPCPTCIVVPSTRNNELCIYMSCVHALPSFLVHWYVLLCILSYRFVASVSRFADWLYCKCR